ncbi:uncharacterized protein pld7 [Nelusetta ayraudi]|uniref:uncharacterized protein pld7 n=1 Tax=Nelusetta ayraudi TaxID=303726 RepID=UPI003F70A780
MPMVLRSRKSIRPGGDDGGELELPSGRPSRRSVRLHRTTYEELSDSDSSESTNDQVMETQPTPSAGPEEDTSGETTALQDCAVMLNRVQSDDRAESRELEEKDDMNRRAGKTASRIPTFSKRPAGAEHLGVPRRDGPEVGGHEPVTKSRQQDGRSLPSPSVRLSRVGLEAPLSLSSASPRGLGPSESAQLPAMSATPRPSLRGQLEEEEKQLEMQEAETEPGVTVPHLPGDGSIHEAEEVGEEEEEKEKEDEGAGDLTRPADVRPAAPAVEVIMDEEPPWSSGGAGVPELKDSRSSSDVEREDESPGREEEEEMVEEEVEEPQEPQGNQPMSLNGAEPQKKPGGASSSTDLAKVSFFFSSSFLFGGCSFVLCCFLPALLLLLGGLGQHVWHYGLPTSVAQLTAQLELHLLEGFVPAAESCSADCRVTLVESLPEGLSYQSSPPTQQSIADRWLQLLDEAERSVDIAAFYVTLRGSDTEAGASPDSQGRMIFDGLKKLQSKGVKLQVAVNAPQTSAADTEELAAQGAEVREVDLKALTGGIVHTKLWVVDQKHLYVGSANMDWRSLSQVKEVGVSLEDCSCLAQDAQRIFGVYWSLGGVNASLPPFWPARLSALSSAHNPLQLRLNGVPARVYLSSAPPQIAARGRTDDLAAILSVIHDARKFVFISVMDFLPLSEYSKPLRFWPVIDSALRAAACTRRVEVRLLVSCWPHSPAAMFTFLQSLQVLSRPPLKCGVHVKIFTVPSTAEQAKIPFARVNHAKYMVTDRVVYIGTSNWSETYFTQTAGVGLVVNQTGSEAKTGQQTLQSQVEALFLRDWTSEHAAALSLDDMDVCPRGSH